MQRIPVKSRDVKSVGYDERTQTLEVEFLSGGIYEYSRVSEQVYEELLQADSKGKYFRRYVRDNLEYSYSQTYPRQRWLRP